MKCPSCRRSFRVPEDEQDMHACPRCGYDGHEDRGEHIESPDDVVPVGPVFPSTISQARRDDMRKLVNAFLTLQIFGDDIRESLHDHIGAYGEHGREAGDDGE